MTDEPAWLSPAWMRAVRRDQQLQALSCGLADMASRIQHREESFIARNGGGWDPEAEQDFRILEGARGLVDGMFAGARDAAIEVAAANKKSGRDFHRMPVWILALVDQAVARFCAPLARIAITTRNQGAASAESDAGMEDIAERRAQNVA